MNIQYSTEKTANNLFLERKKCSKILIKSECISLFQIQDERLFITLTFEHLNHGKI